MTASGHPLMDALLDRFRQVVEAADRLAALDERPSTMDIAELRDPAVVERTATDLVLHAHRIAADPGNYEMLSEMVPSPASLDTIRRRHDWTLIEMQERLQDVLRAGLVAYDIERDRVRLTAAGDAAVRALHAHITALAELIREWLGNRATTGR